MRHNLLTRPALRLAGAVVLLAALLLATTRPAAKAAPAGFGGTPSFLPIVVWDASATPTPTDTQPPTDTPTPTPSPTPTQPAPPASLHITALSGLSNPEYVDIANTGGTAQDMTGWTILSVVGSQDFNFPGGYVLGASQSVRVESYSNATNNPPAILLWGYAPIWNNNGDKAVLYSSTNAVVDSSCYGNGCP